MGCNDCSFGDSCNTNLIESLGPRRSDILVVLDYPTRDEDSKGFLLSGDAGQKIMYLFEQAGIDHETVKFTTAIRCSPGQAKPKKENFIACEKYLAEEYRETRPKVILTMGSTALEQVLGEKTISDVRGDFHSIEFIDDTGGKERVKEINTLCTYGPAYCLKSWEKDSLVIQDLKRVKKFVQTGEIPQPPKLESTLITSMEELHDLYSYLENKTYSYDFETTGFRFHDHKIIMAGFCAEPGKAFVVPYYVYSAAETKKFDPENLACVEKINSFVTKNQEKIKLVLKKIFRSKTSKKIAHNGKFDNNFARYNGFPVSNFWFDTVVAHSLVDENKPHDLTFCLDYYGIGYGNYEKELWPFVNKTKQNKKPYSYVPPLILIDYLAKDVDGTRKLHKKLIRDLKKEGMVHLFLKQQMPLLRLMEKIEYHGIKVDIKRLQSISKDFAVVLEDIEAKIKKLTKIEDFNPNSPKQLSEYLESIGAIGNRGDKKTRGGSFSTDEGVLTGLAMKRKVGRVPRLIIESRTVGKLKSNYLDGTDGETGLLPFIDKKGFCHYSSNIHTPRTGRMSVSSPAIQTIPRPNPKYPQANIRQLFIPSFPDWFMFSIDFKQLEMRVAAYLSKDLVMIKEIQEGVDMHSRNAVTLGQSVGLLPTDVSEKQFLEVIHYSGSDPKMKQLCSEWVELRVMVKALGFGLNYGMGADTLAKDHGQEVDLMQDMIDVYFKKYGAFAIWREEQCDAALDSGLLVLPGTGRKRRFYDAVRWFNSDFSANIQKREQDMEALKRQAMNYPVQGLANELFVDGKLKFDGSTVSEHLESRLLLSLHDGVLGEGPKGEINRIKEIAKRCWERDLGKGKFQVPLRIDFEVYDRWAGNKIAI